MKQDGFIVAHAKVPVSHLCQGYLALPYTYDTNSPIYVSEVGFPTEEH